MSLVYSPTTVTKCDVSRSKFINVTEIQLLWTCD